MITPINNYQTNINFNATLKTPRMKPKRRIDFLKKTELTSKMKQKFEAIKTELNNLDEESEDLLMKITFLSSLVIGFLIYIGHVIKLVMDKIHYFTE